MEKKTCPKCGSTKWMTGLNTFHQGDTVLCVIRETLLHKAKGLSYICAEACGDCGYVQYLLDNPQEMYEEWRKQNA